MGVHFTVYAPPATASEDEAINRIAALNKNPAVHSILVQFPLTKHISVPSALETIAKEKDVDGFHLC